MLTYAPRVSPKTVTIIELDPTLLRVSEGTRPSASKVVFDVIKVVEKGVQSFAVMLAGKVCVMVSRPFGPTVK